jgi:hypothetical protein
MTTYARALRRLERWADDVGADDLVEAKTTTLRIIAEACGRRNDVNAALLDAICAARTLIVPGRN